MEGAGTNAIAALLRLLTEAGRWTDAQVARQSYAAALDPLERDGQLAAVVEATGTTAAELRALPLSPAASEALLAATLRHIGSADAGSVSPEILDALRHTCHRCAETQACRHWLAQPSPDRAELAAFCPNANVLAHITQASSRDTD